MADKLHLHLFGSPQLVWQGKALGGFVSNKARALLIYLAVTGRSHSRDALAELLWADTPTTMRANLKRVLSNLRNLDGVVLREEGQQLVALDRQHTWVDVVEFAQLAAAPTGDVAALQHAVQLYQGEFLAGFPTSISYEFEAWVLAEQAQLKGQLVTLLRRLADEYAQVNDLPQAIATVRRLLQLEPWQEAAHRQLITLLAQHGEVGAALAHFETCRAQLRDELEVEPAAATLELVAQIRAGTFRSQGQQYAVPANNSSLATDGYANGKESTTNLFPLGVEQPTHNLPLAATPFIGRNAELAKLADLIANPNCRLITLAGPGGSGKTRLAIEAARQAHPTFADGVTFVALAPLATTELVVSTIAAALDLTLGGDASPQTQLLQFLRRQARLLVLDNLEQLLPSHQEQPTAAEENEALALIRAILAQAPEINLLITSRERLHLQGEWVYAVEGLDVPTGHSNIPALACSAPTLFIQTAQRTMASFAPIASDEAAILQICRLVDGMPLAIELAAAWVHVLSCQEIVAEIEAGLEILTTALHDLPARHRSMQAVFDHSWRLLSEKEQQVFARCSVFRGGFTRESAQEIADATLPLLAALVDKSLLSSNRDGRYAVHELARQYAARRLDELQATAQTRNRHLAFFAQLAEKAELRLRSGPQCVQWHDRIEIEHDNIRAALDWSLHGGEFETGFQIVGALWEFWMIRSHASEGQRWAERFLKRPEADTPTYTQAKVLHTAGVCAYYHGHYEPAITWLRKASDRSRQLGPPGRYLLALSLTAQGYIMAGQRKQDAVETLANKIMSLGDELNDAWVRGHAWTQLATLEHHRNNKKRAGEYFLESFTSFQADGESVMRGFPLMNLGEMLCELGDFAAAHTYLHAALAIYEELNDKIRYSAVLASLGYLALTAGDLDEAEKSLAAALAHVRKTGQMRTFMKALGTMGRVAQRQGNYNRAHALYVEGLTLILETKRFAFILDSIEAFACLAAEQRQADRAAILFGTVEAQEGLQWLLSSPYLRAEHERWVTCVRKDLGERAFTAAWDRGAAMSIEEAANFALTG